MSYMGGINRVFLGCFLILCGCSDNDRNTKSSESALRDMMAKAGLTGDPAGGRDLPDISSNMAQLGMKPFSPRGWVATRILPVQPAITQCLAAEIICPYR